MALTVTGFELPPGAVVRSTLTALDHAQGPAAASTAPDFAPTQRGKVALTAKGFEPLPGMTWEPMWQPVNSRARLR